MENTMNNMRNRKEIEEAIAAADNAIYYLDRADDALESAGNWGIFDMLGGGFIATMVKHGKMDDAERELSLARDAIRKFSKEMQDIGQITGGYLQVDDFMRFADYFFDGFIADWMVQSKIKKAREQIWQARNHIGNIQKQLKQML